MERGIIPDRLKLQSQSPWEVPTSIVLLSDLLRWVTIARLELEAENRADLAQALYQVGRLSTLAGIEEVAVTSLKQQKGFKKKRSETTQEKESDYREYVNEFSRIKSSTKFSNRRAIQKVMEKFSKSESTIRRALRKNQETLPRQ